MRGWRGAKGHHSQFRARQGDVVNTRPPNTPVAATAPFPHAPSHLQMHLTHQCNKPSAPLPSAGEIVPEECTYKRLTNKVTITLKKANTNSWSKLSSK